jgi:hypothetical protein
LAGPEPLEVRRDLLDYPVADRDLLASKPIRRQIARSIDDLIARMPTHEEAVEL